MSGQPAEKEALAARLTPALRQELDLAGWEASGPGAAPNPGALDALAARLAYRVATVLTRVTPPAAGDPS